MKVLNRIVLLVFILVITLSCGVSAEIQSTNYSNAVTKKDGTNGENKIIRYIQNKKNTGNNNVNIFCVGRDEIIYNESFIDFEKDYFNLAVKDKLKTLQEKDKEINPNNLVFEFVHNPYIYDNPVNVSGISGKPIKVYVEYNNDTRKWEVKSNTDLLFKVPTDDKRGRWDISLTGYDYTGKDIFDKKSIGIASFNVHTPPVPRLTITNSEGYFQLKDSGSYDLDYQYSKNSRKNKPNDREYNGIKEFYWEACIDGKWSSLGNGVTSNKVKSTSKISDFKLTVEDYDGAKTSISKTSLLLEKPISYFDFKAGEQITDYFYLGNKGNETVKVKDLITWKDEAYDPLIYNTSGIRTLFWKSTVKNRTSVSTDSFNNIILSDFKNITANNKIPVSLRVKNKYDLTHETLREAEVIDIKSTNKKSTNTSSCSICNTYAKTIGAGAAYDIGSNVDITYSYANDKININDIITELKIQGNKNDLESINNLFTSSVYLDENEKSRWNKVDYEFNTYSNRTSEFLHQIMNTIVVHTPVEVSGYVNESKNPEITGNEEFKITADTNKFSAGVVVQASEDLIVNGVKYFKNTDIRLSPSDGNTKWSISAAFANDVADETRVVFNFKTTAFNNRDTATDSLQGIVYNYKLENFRVTKVRDLKLSNFYKDGSTFKDVEMDVNYMGIDPTSFLPYQINYLTKGYVFEFKIDSINFNEKNDSVIIIPSFYDITGSSRGSTKKQAYWKTSSGTVLPIGTGGHSNYAKVIMTKERQIDSKRAVWSGKYLIPGTTFLTGSDGIPLSSDIIVNFNIEGYKNGVPKYNYNDKQWSKELITQKYPYAKGDVIRYSGAASNLDDINSIRNRS